MNHLSVFTVGKDQPILFAAQELQKYLQAINASVIVGVASRDGYNSQETGVWLGLFGAFGLSAHSLHPLDDEIHIAVQNGNGIIAGCNPRSVLLAVYRFLANYGCRWVRPGSEGEFIPREDNLAATVHLHERPAYRHRAVCIEGAVSLGNVLDMVNWLPKIGLSGYFMQFREGFTFFDRWYKHKNNPLKSPEPFSVEQARQLTHQIETELQKRGLIYHAIGHGWTCEAFSVPCLGWDMETGRQWPPEFLRYVAEVNGKRAVPWDIVSIAALCYSDPVVQEKLVACVVDYAASHPQIDLLHVWLDDGFNNKCECPNCRQRRPADYYLDILNLIDERLSQRDLPHKIVFLAYVDMLWPPETARIKHPDRFVFMFAPISRAYRQAMTPTGPLPALPPFEQNHLQFPSDINGLLAFLRAWQAIFQGDSFVYDYHFISSGLYTQDPGLLRLARLVSEDVKLLKTQGLNGLVNCQLQRVFFPTGLGMYAMAQTLWDDTLDFDALASDYFRASFGEEGQQARIYLDQLAELLDLGDLQAAKESLAPTVGIRCQEALSLVNEFEPVIERNLGVKEACHARSWQYLRSHAHIVREFANMLQARAAGQPTVLVARWEALKQWVREREDDLQPVLDVWAFVESYDNMLVKPKT